MSTRAITSSAVSIAVVKGAPVASRVVLLLAMAHFASSAEELARVSYAIAISESVRLITSGSMELWGMRAIGLAAAHATARATTAMAVVRLLFSLLGGAIAAALTYFAGHGGIVLALLSSTFVIAGEAFGVAVIYYLARSTPAVLVPVSVLCGLLAIFASIGMLASGVDPTIACAVVALGEVCAALYFLAKLRSAGILTFFPDLAAACRSLLRETAPTTAFSSIVAVYSRLDAVFLNAFSVAAFATYTVAFRATQPVSFAFGSLSLAVYASLVRAFADSDTASRAKFRRLASVIFAAAVVAAALTFAGCAWLISAFAPAYADSLGPLLVLCVMMPFGAINNVGLYALGGEGRFRALVTLVAINLISTTILMWLLVPAHGALGASLALLGCQLLNTALLLALEVRTGSGLVSA